MKLFKIIAWIMIGFLILSPIISGILFILMFGLIDINSILLTTGIYSIGFIFFLFNSLILFGFFILGKRTNNKLLSIIPWVTFCLLLIYIIIIISRIISLQFHTSKERYDFFFKTARNKIQRVPLGMLASHLGMTQETLSRVRAEKSSF